MSANNTFKGLPKRISLDEVRAAGRDSGRYGTFDRSFFAILGTTVARRTYVQAFLSGREQRV